ncbi:MAG: NAD-dependent histone deacetylase sir2 [Tremellales sp. Tagirdzhanova-0007]|nr:MAG: NAD-dependent histone deacetylase sir2 [Tremellales sp. Tagirdzhanova-0007]
MSDGALLHEITPGETYQLDSDEFSEEEPESLGDEEYDGLVDEAESGYTDEDMRQMTHELKERGLIAFLRDYLVRGEATQTPSLRKLLLGFGILPPSGLRHPSNPDIFLLPFAKIALSRILRRREKLPHLNTIPQAVELLRNARNIIILSGAGISTSCGIPDFRSSTGLYAQLQAEGKYDLDDPQQMFDIHYFKEHPEVFYSFAKHIYPSNFVPSPCHRWIKLLEDRGVLLRNYTQNIDTLESLAGVTKVLSPLRVVSALKAARRKGKGKYKARWDGESDSDEEGEWAGGDPGIMKPDITFFGQALDSDFDDCLFRDRDEVDLLVIIGTSLRVAPVSEVLTHIPHSVPQIFINLTPISHVQPDICLLGDADTIVSYLSNKLGEGWEIPPSAVVNSPKSGCNPVQDVKAQSPESNPQIPFEDISWISGVGQLQHIHLLVSNTGKPVARVRATGPCEDHNALLEAEVGFDGRPMKKPRLSL